jgi:hypothetical protein
MTRKPSVILLDLAAELHRLADTLERSVAAGDKPNHTETRQLRDVLERLSGVTHRMAERRVRELQ